MCELGLESVYQFITHVGGQTIKTWGDEFPERVRPPLFMQGE